MVEVTWDYSGLADSYHKRAPYSQQLIEQVIEKTGLTQLSVVCDVGAGTGFLSREFAARNIAVNAVEPNGAMRHVGERDCHKHALIKWYNAQAENTAQPEQSVDMVSFGSSFNVVNRSMALAEASRIVLPDGWFLALWNHRDLTVGLQFEIEQYIKQCIPTYQYGLRRTNQTDYLQQSGYFKNIQSISSAFDFVQPKTDVIQAWHSHATLKRQAGDLYPMILSGIESLIEGDSSEMVTTRFYTQAWLAQFKSN